MLLLSLVLDVAVAEGWSSFLLRFLCVPENRSGIDSQVRTDRQRRKTGITAIEFYVRVLVEGRSTSRASEVSDSYTAISLTNLKIGDVKYGQCDIA